jgi:hypothetical protein
MPPWPPTPTATYKHDRSLPRGAARAIVEWVGSARPRATPPTPPPPPADAPPVIESTSAAAAEPFTPTIAPDEYRCFLLDWPKDQDSYATASTCGPASRRSCTT